MRKSQLICIVFVILFVIPISGNFGNIGVIDSQNEKDEVFQDPVDFDQLAGALQSTGTGPALPVSFTGTASNPNEGLMTIDSTTPGTGTVYLEDGWSGSDLTTSVDTMTTTYTRVAKNYDLSSYHSEKFIETDHPSVDVDVPDYWVFSKENAGPGDSSPHPYYGIFEINPFGGSGYSGDMGWRYEAAWGIGDSLSTTDYVSYSQHVSAPYRELYDVEISFRYRVISSSNMNDQVYLYVDFAGYTTEFHVFESGDTTDTWLQSTFSVPGSHISTLSLPNSLLVEVGLSTDLSGSQGSAQGAYVFVDDIEVNLDVRPFPEQIGLKANGTAIVGSTPGSIYPYVPDGENRDCYDDDSTGIDLDGYSNDGQLAVGIWSSTTTDWANAYTYQIGLQFPVDIPQGAAITSAYLEVETVDVSDMSAMRIYLAGTNTTGDPIVNFTSGTPHLEDRYEWVDTSIDWTVNNYWLSQDTDVILRQESPDLTSLVQAIVSDSGWVSGQHMVVMLDYMHSSTSQAYNEIKGSSNYVQSELARLNVEYLDPLPEDEVYTFNYEKDITISSSQVAATLSDFPVLIDIYDTDLKTKVQPDGDDIAFRMGDTALEFEIETFDQSHNSTHAHLVAWVKVPTLSRTQDTTMTMMYGNPDIGSLQSSRVWDEYSIVQHMNHNPTGIQSDSTSNNNDGTSYGNMDSSDLVTGQIGGALDFDGTDDAVSVGQIDTDDWSSFTVSGWLYHTLNDDNRVISKSWTTSSNQHILCIRVDSGGTFTIRLWTEGTGGTGGSYNGGTISTNGWYFVAFTWSASTGYARGYIDGTRTVNVAHGGTDILDADEMFVIGNNNVGDSTQDRYWNGYLDEIRITTAERPESWIDTEYNNQNSPDTFYSVGSERTIRDTWQDQDTAEMTFTTTSTYPVTLGVTLDMEITGSGQSLDDSYSEGTTYFVANDTVVEWDARILVSPPANTSQMDVNVDYPMTEWRPDSVRDPLNNTLAYGTDWDYEGGTLTIYLTLDDEFGVYTIEFSAYNYVSDVQLGISGQSLGDTATLDINDDLKVRATTPWVTNARVGYVLTDPDGQEWYSTYNTTTGTPTHLFPSFKYRRTLTVSSSEVTSDLTDYPLLIRLTSDSILQDTTKLQADGDDILFVSPGGDILPHEIERFDQTNGILIAWVKTNLSSTVDNVITMYYGNPVLGSQENPSAVWSDSYDAVYHLGESATAGQSTAVHYDSTSNEYDAGQNGNARAAGRFTSYGQYFDGTDDKIVVSSTKDLEPSGDVWISGWFRITATHDSNSATKLLVAKFIDDNTNFHVALAGNDYQQGAVPAGALSVKVDTNGYHHVYTTKTSWAAGWYHFTFYMDASSLGNNKIYIDGSDDTAGVVGSGSTGSLAFNADWSFGGGFADSFNFAGGTGWFNGYLDEIRFTTTSLSSGWIATDYNIQDTPSVSAGTEQERVSPEHTMTKTIEPSYAAGVWTVSSYYNDTGTNVTYRTGLFEREFIVKHDTSLSFNAPGDAIGDQLSVKVLGDALYVEMELSDDIDSSLVPGATVTMNWTDSGSPEDLTLDDYGDGRYGKSLNTTDLVSNQRWRINIASSHPYYNDATTYFDLDLLHETVITHKTPSEVPYDDDLSVKITVRDAYNNNPVSGASISSNGTIVGTPTDYGNGSYLVTLDSTGLNNGEHVYEVSATPASSYLTDSSVDVTFTIRKIYTVVYGIGGNSINTPYNIDTSLQITLNDTDHGFIGVEGATDSVTDPSGITTTVSGGTNGVYTASIDVGTAIPGNYYIDITFSKANYYSSTITLLLVIEPHDTFIIINHDDVIPWGVDSSFEVKWYDKDLSNSLISGHLDQVSVTSTTEGTQSFGSLGFTLDTSSWGVGTYQLNVTVHPSDTLYYYGTTLVNITVRRHYTSVNIQGAVSVPYGNDTPLTVVFWDLDTDSQVPIVNVTTNGVSFDAGVLGTQTFTTYSPTLVTNSWSVGTHSVTLTVTCVDSNLFYKSAQHTFSIEIRSLMTVMYNEPSDLIFPSGDDFVIYLRVNVSEPSASDGNPVTGLTQGEFSVPPYTIAIDTTDNGVGRYKLTIAAANFGDGDYEITVYVNPSDSTYDSTQLVIHFTYRPARSFLSSPNYPQVVTPFDTDVKITLNYTDVDRDEGITGATIGNESINIYNVEDLNNGEYTLYIDVEGLAEGTHEFNLTADAGGYEAKYLSFTVLIRVAFTYAIPTVGSLDVPVGNDPVFYVNYTDIDHDVPVDNSSSDVTVDCTWATFTVTYLSGEGRYKITFITEDTDTLQQNTLVNFTFSRPNYQDGKFSITVTIRTHNTDFRLVSAVDPTSSEGTFNISVYYGDLDNAVGIWDSNVAFRVENTTGEVSSTAVQDMSLGTGFYIIRVSASQFGLGIQYFTVYANWTGTVYKYQNKTLSASGNVVGVDSSLTLIEASEPTAYLGNMSYVFFFSEFSSGTGIENDTGDVHIYVSFEGESVNLSKVDIWEVNQATQPGNYSIQFNTTIFARTGIIYMNVFINWSKGVAPYYTNRTDTISVRVLARDTLVSIAPPSPTSYDEYATFTMNYEDVTGGASELIYDDPKLTLSMNITFSYAHDAGTFTFEFNTSQFGALGVQAIQLNITWGGSPFYANRTNRIVFITVLYRLTVVEYLAPAPTPYLDNVTFSVTWTDVSGATSSAIDGANLTLYDGANPVNTDYYSYEYIGSGEYEFVFNTTYYSTPGTYGLTVEIISPLFYYENRTVTRQFDVRSRVSILTYEPVSRVPYNSSITVILNYQDLYTLTNINNVTGDQDPGQTTITIVNGTDWTFVSEWKPAFGYYELTIDTYNHPELETNVVYVLNISISYDYVTPFYLPDFTYIPFELRIRSSSLDLDDAPTPTSYLEYVNFTVSFSDNDAGGTGIDNSVIALYKGMTEITDFLAVEVSTGVWELSVNTTALDGLGATLVTVYANRSGVPYHSNETLDVSLSVNRRPTNVEILVSPPQTSYLDNITFTIAFLDLGSEDYVSGIDSNIQLINGTTILDSSLYVISDSVVPGTYDISINTTVLGGTLYKNLQVVVKIYWLDVVPFYRNDTSTIKMTATQRLGSLTWEPIESTPLRDLMNLTFFFEDLDRGYGIENAIILFDCPDVPGFSSSDYTLIVGTGVDAGRYVIRINTSALLGIQSYTFELDVHWDPDFEPYYKNITTKVISGTVRLISSSLGGVSSSPSTVPYYENITIEVTFTDDDHNTPVSGVDVTNISITYQPGDVVPQIWSVQDLGSGIYRILLNISDSGAAGGKTVEIAFDWYPYSVSPIPVSFQVRYRVGSVGVAEVPEDIYAGDPTYVLLNITDVDGNDAPLDGVVLTLTWSSSSSYDYVGGGIYNVSLSTTGLVPGLRQLTVESALANFTIQTINVEVNLKAVTTEILMAGDWSSPLEITWGENTTIYAYFNDTVHSLAIQGATVEYTWIPGVWSPLAPSESGNYSVLLDTYDVSATTVIVTVRASKPNYLTSTTTITLSILPRPVNLDPASGQFTISVARGSEANISVLLEDVLFGTPVTGATVEALWNFGTAESSPLLSTNGYYEYFLDTNEAVAGSSYPVTVTATKPNYQTVSVTFQLFVTQTATSVYLDDDTSGYEDELFSWSEVVRVRVLFLAPQLDVSDPDYYQWNSTVVMISEDIQLEFTPEGQTGYFYCDFNTTNYVTGTYNFKILATPRNRAFSVNSSRVVITVRPINTDISVPVDQSRVWGHSGWYYFNYTDLFHDEGIDNESYGYPVTALFDYVAGEGNATYIGNGTYGIFIDTTGLTPSSQPYSIKMTFEKNNFRSKIGSFDITVLEVPTELIVDSPLKNRIDEQVPTNLQIPIGDSVTFSLFFNDTDNADGYVGGLEGAVATADSLLRGDTILSPVPITVVDIGGGWYNVTFLTVSAQYNVSTSKEYTLTIELELINRKTALRIVRIRVIEIPTELIVLNDINEIVLRNGDTFTVQLFYNDTWHNRGIPGATFNANSSDEAIFTTNYYESVTEDGYYYIEITTSGIKLSGASAQLAIFIGRENYKVPTENVDFIVRVTQNDTDILVLNGLQFGLPISLFIIMLLVGYVKVWSVPKRLRQINGQLKAIRKGKMPKPIDAAKSRQELVAELFNDTYEEFEIIRSPSEMPEEAVSVDIPEMGELLIQLSILTNLSQDELDEFKADISKMRLSEQAAFVKEVIHQEAIRAARREGKDIDVIMSEIAKQASMKISGEFDDEDIEPRTLPDEERIFTLPDEDLEDEISTEDLDTEPDDIVDEPPEGPDTSEDMLSPFELEEIRSDLLKKGVPAHEIDTIMEQAKTLPRDLVEELLRSLGVREE